MFTVQIRRIYDPILPDDGFRNLVDRLWSRGISKEQAKVDMWMKEIALSNDLRKSYHNGSIEFNCFRAYYFKELQNDEYAAELNELYSEKLQAENVTLLYAAKNSEENNAVVLQEWLRINKSRLSGGIING